MPSPLRVALLVESYAEYGRGLLRGIATYMRNHARWTVYHQPWAFDSVWQQLRRWRPDGMIAQMETPQLVRQVQKLGIPVVGFSTLDLPTISTFVTDQQAVARMAADHLLERGLRHFAYAGFAGVRFPQQRREAFVDYLARAGHSVAVFEGPKIGNLLSPAASEAYHAVDAKAITEWFKSLPRPLGLMACDDLYARQIANACNEYGIAIPDEVALIGAGNDEVVCSLGYPGLSTVELDADGTGYRAAAMLDRLMHGTRRTHMRALVAPKGVITRQSTDILLGADQDVVDAIRYVRQRACEGVRVKDLFRHTMLSRSTLQRRFTETLGRSPKAELLRVQLERVKMLLTTTDLPLLKIAQQTGFNHVECMCRLFKSRTGRTPRQYRNETRTQGSARKR